MDLYYRLGKIFALHVEISKELGTSPFFRFYTCKGETILDIPYIQVIFTGSHSLKNECAHLSTEKQDTRPYGTNATEQNNPNFEGISKD